MVWLPWIGLATKSKPRADLAYLCRAMKAPSMLAGVERLAERARADGWSHQEFLAVCLEHGGSLRFDVASSGTYGGLLDDEERVGV